jgi:hypothetical protein
VPGVSASGAVTDAVKFGVRVVTLLLIVTLRFFERTYELFQQAASTRARVLERILNVEITDTITSRYHSGHVREWITLVYVSFSLGVGTLGFFIVPKYVVWVVGSTVATIVVLFLTMLLSLEYDNGLEDWTIDKQECTKGP